MEQAPSPNVKGQKQTPKTTGTKYAAAAGIAIGFVLGGVCAWCAGWTDVLAYQKQTLDVLRNCIRGGQDCDYIVQGGSGGLKRPPTANELADCLPHIVALEVVKEDANVAKGVVRCRTGNLIVEVRVTYYGLMRRVENYGAVRLGIDPGLGNITPPFDPY